MFNPLEGLSLERFDAGEKKASWTTEPRTGGCGYCVVIITSEDI